MSKPLHLGRPRGRLPSDEELLEVAFGVFERCGYAQARTDEIARLAGVSKGTLFHRFKSKEGLFFEAICRKIEPPLDGLEGLVAGDEVSSEALLIHYFDLFERQTATGDLHQVQKVVLSEAAAFPEIGKLLHDRVVVRALDTISSILTRGVARGEFREGPFTRHPMLVSAASVLVSQAQLIFSDASQWDAKGILDDYLEVLLASLRPGP